MIGAAMPVGGPFGAPAFASDPIGSSEAVGVGERPVGGPAGGPAFAGDPIGSSEAVVVVGCEANTGGGGLGRLITVVGAEVPVAISSSVSGGPLGPHFCAGGPGGAPAFAGDPVGEVPAAPKRPRWKVLWATKERRVVRPWSDSICNVDHMFEHHYVSRIVIVGLDRMAMVVVLRE